VDGKLSIPNINKIAPGMSKVWFGQTNADGRTRSHTPNRYLDNYVFAFAGSSKMVIVNHTSNFKKFEHTLKKLKMHKKVEHTLIDGIMRNVCMTLGNIVLMAYLPT